MTRGLCDRLVAAAFLALIFGAMVSWLSGCASTTPAQAAFKARQVYNATLDTLVAARKAGEISDNEYREIEEVRKVAVLALDEMDIHISGGSGFDSALASFNVAIDRLLEWRAKVKGKI